MIKYRGGTVVLYPLAKYQPEVKQLHGKKVHVVINNKRIKSNYINLYENQNSRKRAKINQAIKSIGGVNGL